MRGQDEERQRKYITMRITHPPLAQGNTELKEIYTYWRRHENTKYVLIKQHAESFTPKLPWMSRNMQKENT